MMQESRTGLKTTHTGPKRQGDDSGGGGGQSRRRRRRRSRGRRPSEEKSDSQNQQGGRRGRGRGRSDQQSSSQDRGAQNSNRHNNRNQNKGGSGGGRQRYRRPEQVTPLTPFEMFCAYHLGIIEHNGYRKSKARDVARQFDVSLQEFQEAMRRFGLERSALKECSFDLELAQLDIRVAPDGIDRRELAKVLFDELLDLNEATRTHHEAALKAAEEARAKEAARKADEDDDEDDDDFDDEEE